MQDSAIPGIARALDEGIAQYQRSGNIQPDAGEDFGPADDLTETLFDKKGNWRADPRVFGTQPGDALEQEEFWEVFRMCLAGLPQRLADVFTLREMEELSSERICKELELSTSYLWVLLYRARLRLSHCIKAHWSDE